MYGVPSVSKILPNGIFVYLLRIYKYDSYLSKYLSYLYTSARYSILDLGIYTLAILINMGQIYIHGHVGNSDLILSNQGMTPILYVSR